MLQSNEGIELHDQAVPIVLRFFGMHAQTVRRRASDKMSMGWRETHPYHSDYNESLR